ncbi:hypothetical protein LCGC14_1071840 [marine sediment metagenome]|uniref:Uncharacterized protein n=1 Tax=marine sediment metagenome TaxID=412755 RepID=A0A0F9MMZ7_9ZZZZ
MEKENEPQSHISYNLRESSGSSEGARLYIITTISTGKTEVVLEKTIKKRFPIQKFNDVKLMYERLNGGGGRRVITIEDLIKLSR